MPRNAVATGVVDFVLNPEEMAGELAALANHIEAVPADPAVVFKNAAVLKSILAVVHERCGVDFTHYKASTVERRLARRMALQRLNTPEEYLKLLEQSPQEAHELFGNLLITVTEFFRDPSTFASLIENALPAMLTGRHSGDPIRVWVPGCSTGKEVYSIANRFV